MWSICPELPQPRSPALPLKVCPKRFPETPPLGPLPTRGLRISHFLHSHRPQPPVSRERCARLAGREESIYSAEGGKKELEADCGTERGRAGGDRATSGWVLLTLTNPWCDGSLPFNSGLSQCPRPGSPLPGCVGRGRWGGGPASLRKRVGHGLTVTSKREGRYDWRRWALMGDRLYLAECRPSSLPPPASFLWWGGKAGPEAWSVGRTWG